MRFLADECCDASVVSALREDGHAVLYVAESMRSITDTEVLKSAFEARQIVLTEDKDFGELVYRLHRPAHGIVLLRFAEDEQDAKVSRLRHLLQTEAQRLAGSFVVLDADKIRIRPLR